MWKALAAVAILAGIAALWPRQGQEAAMGFDEARLAGGVAAYLETAEAAFPDIIPGVRKQVIWAGEPEVRTPLALVYVHGFSATAQEIRPVPDIVAARLGANLVFTRLAGHGRGGAAMAEATLADWRADMAEALALGRAVGERVVILGTSTGATLAALALHEDARDVAGVVMVAPNFRVKAAAAALLNWPGARLWLPPLAGRERVFEALSDEHARYWATRYPSAALFPMAEAVRAARRLRLEDVTVPALIIFDPRDTVVDHAQTRKVAARWGGGATLSEVTVGPGDDPGFHVVAGDILSPSMTRPVAARIADWIEGL